MNSGLIILTKEQVKAAGLAVVAEDTGRVLMLQRSLEEDGPASGKWEFPGGKLDHGETPLEAAKREWEEETGMVVPGGRLGGEWVSPNGVYVLSILFINKESTMAINLDHEDRPVTNPDDPDGDNIETLAWWNVDDLKGNPAVREEALATDWRLLKREVEIYATGIIEFHLPGQHDQSSHGRPGTKILGARAELENELNKTFGSDTVRRINEAGHNVSDYNLRDKDGNLTGKPLPGSDSWRDSHGISKDVYDSRPVKRWDSPKDPVFDEMYGQDAQQKTFAKKLANQSDGFIMERKPLPGAEAQFGPIPPQARPDNKVVVDQRAKSRREREVATAQKRIEQLETYTGDDIVKERQTRVNKLKRELSETKVAEADEIVSKPKAKLDKAEASLRKAEASGDDERISEAKLNRAIAKAEFQDADNRAKLIRRDDRHAAVGIVQQELNGANAALSRAKADPNKALQNAKDAAANNLERKQAALDKTAVKYAFPPGKGSASRMEAHQDPQNIKNLTEGKGKVYFVMEGQIKADAVLSAVRREDPTAAVVSVPSVTAWNKDEVSWATKTYLKGRDVVLIPDADGVTNPAVVKQAKTLQGRMENDGAGRVFVASPPLIKNKRGKLEVEDIWYPTGVKDGRKGVDDHLGLGQGTLGDLRFNDTPSAKFDLSKETGARRIRPNAQGNATRALQSISDLAGGEGIQRISRDSIVKHSGLPDTSTKDALNLLEKKGYIKQHHLFDPKALGRNRREPAMEFDEMKRITRKAGVGIPDLSKKYVLDDDRHEVAPIIEILDKRFVTQPGPSKSLKSVFGDLQASDRVVRTPEGAARYGVPVGSKIPGAELSVTGLITFASDTDHHGRQNRLSESDLVALDVVLDPDVYQALRVFDKDELTPFLPYIQRIDKLIANSVPLKNPITLYKKVEKSKELLRATSLKDKGYLFGSTSKSSPSSDEIVVTVNIPKGVKALKINEDSYILPRDLSIDLQTGTVESFHLTGQHDQSSHGRSGASGPVASISEDARKSRINKKIKTALIIAGVILVVAGAVIVYKKQQAEGCDGESAVCSVVRQEANNKRWDLPEKDQRTLESYISSGGEGGSNAMNDVLRGKRRSNPTIDKTIKDFDQTFEKGAVNTKGIKTYRGVREFTDAEGNIQSVSNLKVGDVIKDNGYMSTSTSKAVAKTYSFEDNAHVMEIQHSPKTKAIAGFYDQKELVLNKGTSVKVKAIKQDKLGNVLYETEIL